MTESSHSEVVKQIQLGSYVALTVVHASRCPRSFASVILYFRAKQHLKLHYVFVYQPTSYPLSASSHFVSILGSPPWPRWVTGEAPETSKRRSWRLTRQRQQPLPLVGFLYPEVVTLNLPCLRRGEEGIVQTKCPKPCWHRG